MICSRCNKEFDSYKAERNAEVFGTNLFACPYCGKPYRFTSKIVVQAVAANTTLKEDDWGNKIVNDNEYVK